MPRTKKTATRSTDNSTRATQPEKNSLKMRKCNDEKFAKPLKQRRRIGTVVLREIKKY